MKFIIGAIILLSTFLLLKKIQLNKKWKLPKGQFPDIWKKILLQKVSFYNSLSQEEQRHFEYKVHEFLSNCDIIGINVEVDDTDKVLVAASAIIPIFSFKDWQYLDLKEVILYPSSFNERFETSGEGRSILGMVGTGYMEGKMILSKPALYHGFDNESDKKNTAIHEFVHLIDKADGSIDGIPSALLERQYTIPWIDLIGKKISEICKNDSDINPYGATNNAEFFSVASEYFFERPKLLEIKHPELYALLQQIFKHDTSNRNLKRANADIGRNDPCICGSGIKYKKCCGKTD